MKELDRALVDDVLTYAFISKAYDDGFAKPCSSRAIEDEHSKDILLAPKRFVNSWDLFVAHALLYEKLYLVPFDNFSLYDKHGQRLYPSPQVINSPIDVFQEGVYERQIFGSFEIKEDIIPLQLTTQFIKAFARVHREQLGKIADKIIDMEDPRLIEELYNAREYLASLSLEEEQCLAVGPEKYREPILAEIIAEYRNLPPPPPRTVPKRCLDAKEREKYELYSTLKDIYTQLLSFMETVTKINAEPGVYITHNFDKQILGEDISRSKLKEIFSKKKDEYVVIGLVFKHLHWTMPKTVSELWNIIDRTDITDFRSEIHSLITDLEEGKLTLKEIENKLSKVNESVLKIKSIKSIEKIGSLITYIFLPADIILSIWLNAPIGVGTLATLAVLPPYVYSLRLKRKYKRYLIDLALKDV